MIRSDLADIIHLEQSAPLSWYDWWNYWSVFIGIIFSIILFLLLTVAFYSISSSDGGKDTKLVPFDSSKQDIDTMVNELLYQKRLTL